MRLWRWLTAWTPKSRAENKKLKTHLFRALLPGVDSSLIDGALRGLSSDLQSDEAFRAIFEQEAKAIDQIDILDQLQTELSKIDEEEWSFVIWKALESQIQFSELRERITERLIESHWVQEMVESLGSHGVPRSICTLPLT